MLHGLVEFGLIYLSEYKENKNFLQVQRMTLIGHN
jgi:hypothetical protein